MLISIITINYNDVAGLKKTMTSVLGQTYPYIEYIVIDGGSTDGSKEYIEQHKEQLAYWISEPDSGIYNAMNKGIDKARGEYLLFLNGGDYLYKTEIIEKVSKLLLGGKDLYYGNLLLDRNGNFVEAKYPESLSFSYFYYRGHLPHPATFIKRNLFSRVYKFKEEFKIVGDYDFLVCAVCKHNASYEHFDEFVTVYDTTGISGNPEYRALLLSERKRSLQSNFPLFTADAERLLRNETMLKTKRFKLLSNLEGKPRAEKMNNYWLKLLTKIFQ
ncbi:glycosyltransferase family 2 protein [Marixanthomonas spongiae]|uniref:glycosyltransferase family 2 protein n=1 Tax=Marixanthomonas spongiae TaxID=2174845 RepID=UPI001403380D|nr:glycosyltransferase family 2 protein [Marixanthomonas spongiae]